MNLFNELIRFIRYLTHELQKIRRREIELREENIALKEKLIKYHKKHGPLEGTVRKMKMRVHKKIK